MLIGNVRARREPYGNELRSIMNIARAREGRQWLSHWSELNPAPTPLWQLPGLARRFGLAELLVKDESKRSPLGSFKALGAPIALVRLILRRRPDGGFTPKSLFEGRHAQALRDWVVISATDGNHGRALAAAARSIGCRCVIVLHRNVSLEREAPIAALGATIMRIDGNYDDSVAEAARMAAQNGWQVVSDTSYEGYEAIPRDVMQGYSIIADEVLEQCAASGSTQPFTHVFLQGGVGGLAAGFASHLQERYGADRPVLVVVEPAEADCLYQSALQGRAARATGSVDSIMAGLACGQASPLAWRFVEAGADYFATVQDAYVPAAMRALAEGCEGDIPIVSGESGAAGVALLLEFAAGNGDAGAQLALDRSARVLLINTEGDTAPHLYQRLAGRAGDAVLAAQRAWIEESAGFRRP